MGDRGDLGYRRRCDGGTQLISYRKEAPSSDWTTNCKLSSNSDVGSNSIHVCVRLEYHPNNTSMDRLLVLFMIQLPLKPRHRLDTIRRVLVSLYRPQFPG